MAKGKDVRVRVILECTGCVRTSPNNKSRGISRYITQKNRHNTPSRLELRKFCSYCYKHTYRFNGRTAQPLEHTTAPGGEEPTSRCQTFPSM